MQRVMCPPIDFRQEKNSGPEATVSASFVVPRGANMIRVISTMVPPDEVNLNPFVLKLVYKIISISSF